MVSWWVLGLGDDRIRSGNIPRRQEAALALLNCDGARTDNFRGKLCLLLPSRRTSSKRT
jgi:hypothetical protein